MNIHLIIIYALSLCLAVMALSAAPENRGAAFDEPGRFPVQAPVPPAPCTSDDAVKAPGDE